MDQKLYNQLLDAAAVMFKISGFDQSIGQKREQQWLCTYEMEKIDKKIRKAGRFCIPLIVFGIIIMAFACLVGLATFLVPLEMVLEVLEGSAPIAELPSFEEFLIVFIIGSVISVVIFLIGFVAFFGALITLIVLKKSTTKSGNAKKDRCKSRYNELEEEIQELLKQKNTYIEKTERYVSFLPSCYRNPQAIGFMLQSVTNLRADTLKEVINLYEHELHMLEQERILNNVAEMQRIQNENTMYALNAIQQNQERINSNLRDIHTWQIFSTFSD